MHARPFPVLLVASLCACVTTPAPPPPPPPPVEEEAKPAGPTLIEIPRRDGTKVLLLPIRPVNAPLFPAELDRLERWTARHLATQPQVVLDPVPLEEVSAARTRLQTQKQLRQEGPVCAAIPPLEPGLRLQWPDAVIARTWADCSVIPCRLLVQVTSPADGAVLGSWSALVEDASDFAAWEKAAQLLTVKPDAAPPSAPTASKPAVEEPFMSVENVTGYGPWTEPPSAATLAPLSRQLETCHEKGRVPKGPHLVAIDYDEKGAAERCAAYGVADPPPSAQLQCLCEVFEGHAVGEGSGDRRLTVQVRERAELSAMTRERDLVVSSVQNYRSTDPALTEDLLSSALPWISLCYATTRLHEPLKFSVKFQLDGSGRIEAATLDGLNQGHPVGPCIEGYLRYHAFPCPPSGSATVEFDVLIERLPREEAEDQKVPTSAAPILPVRPGARPDAVSVRGS